MKQLIRLTESDIHRIVKESVNRILKENSFDYYGRAEDDYLSREKLPKGWSKSDRDDDEPIYSDEDGNEYVKDEYGRFKNVNEDIDIDPKNKGKFTATQKRTGKSTEELCHSKNPLTRKRANFAKMAKRGWKPLN